MPILIDTPTYDLRALRLSKGLLQTNIGNRKDISDIERGVKFPGIRLIKRMANALGVSSETVYAACDRSHTQRIMGYPPQRFVKRLATIKNPKINTAANTTVSDEYIPTDALTYASAHDIYALEERT